MKIIKQQAITYTNDVQLKASINWGSNTELKTYGITSSIYNQMVYYYTTYEIL